MKGGEYKSGVSQMHFILRDQELKTSTYKYSRLYKNIMVTTKQKSIIDIYTKKKKKNPNILLKIVITSQEKRMKEEREKKTYKNKFRTIV